MQAVCDSTSRRISDRRHAPAHPVCRGIAVTRRRGFTLIDVLVSVFVVSLLIGLLVPVLGEARVAAERVVCASNVRQIGLGTALYADDYGEYMPPTIYDGTYLPESARFMSTYRSQVAPTESNTLRVGSKWLIKNATFNREGWDGLGLLFSGEYVPVAETFYCPAHDGDEQIEAYAEAWAMGEGHIRGNYQYRGVGPNGERRLSMIEPETTAIISDSLRTLGEFSHVVGCTVMTANLAVKWQPDTEGLITSTIPPTLSYKDGLPLTFNAHKFRFPIQQSWETVDQLLGRPGWKR